MPNITYISCSVWLFCNTIAIHLLMAGNRHKQNSWFCKEIREDNSGFGGGAFTKTLRKVCTCKKLTFSFLLLGDTFRFVRSKLKSR